MVIEIAIPHILPLILIIYFNTKRCYDRRGCRNHKSNSR